MTNITTDFHMHSTFSPDGDDSPAVLCQAALAQGLTAIAITEHAEWQPGAGFTGLPETEVYFAEMARCRAKFAARGLQVYTGVELGNPHQFYDEATWLVESYPFDVVIASLHWLNGHNIHMPECFAGRDPYEVYTEYFIQLARLASDFHFDILAHFDRIIWRGTLLGIGFDPHRIERVVRHALATVAEHGRVLELNTRSVNDPDNWNEAMVTMFRWFREAGGNRVVINSDAHRRGEVGRNRAIAQQMLAQAGFTYPANYFQLNPAIQLDMAA